MSPTGNMKEQLEQYVKDVKDCYEQCRDNEAATKASLIVPLFTILGYHVADPGECKPEYKANFGKNNKARKAVDWAFFVNDALAFLVEAKAVGKKISTHDEQLRIYYTEGAPVTLGILTTGVQWRFFTDLAFEHVMDKKPFLEWDVLKDDAIPFEFLTILQRAEFKPELIKTWAKLKHRQSLLVAELTRLLEPSPEFVKLAIQNFENRNMTAAVIGEWKPILIGAIHEWAKQQMLRMALDRDIDTQDGSQPHPPKTKRTLPPKTKGPVSLKSLIDAGILQPGKLTREYKGINLQADLLPSGAVRFKGESYKTCSAAADVARSTVTGKKMYTNGWSFWHYVNENGKLVRLDTARQMFLKTKGK